MSCARIKIISVIPKILVVDDMPSMRQLIVATVRSLGYKAEEADCGARGLQLLETNTYQLVLSDWNMPGMTGAQFVSALRQRKNSIPVIMVTAECSRDCVLEMKAIGVSGYLIKPFKADALATVVTRALGVE
ncbi:response regulator [Ferrovum sp.]|uniref:response regulator n=1 Tax=Ferrovum sp. TaxID=2609467 RepID=UPI0026166DF8|nr:response regulator [Ferrovum sp.]